MDEMVCTVAENAWTGGRSRLGPQISTASYLLLDLIALRDQTLELGYSQPALCLYALEVRHLRVLS